MLDTQNFNSLSKKVGSFGHSFTGFVQNFFKEIDVAVHTRKNCLLLLSDLDK